MGQLVVSDRAQLPQKASLRCQHSSSSSASNSCAAVLSASYVVAGGPGSIPAAISSRVCCSVPRYCRQVAQTWRPPTRARQPPRPCRRRFGREVVLDQVRRLPATILDRGGDEPASAHTGETGLRHQSRHPHASNISTLGRKLGMNARRAVGAARGRMRHLDLRDQRGVGLGPLRRPPLPAAGTSWQSDNLPGDHSRTGTLRRDRVRLPSEPGGRL